MEIEMLSTPLLEKTVDASTQFKIICHEGGSRSSKTISIMQFWLNKALKGQKFDLTIGRDKMTWLKESVLQDFDDLTSEYEIPVTPNINKRRDDQTYKIFNATFDFWGLDDIKKLHGKKQDYFWLNEAMEISKEAFDQIEMRTARGGIIDYNPTDEDHWIFNEHLRPDVTVIKSTMLDNVFNPQSVINKILSYDPNNPVNVKNGTADLYMWQVYGLGIRAKLEGLIFENVESVDAVPANAKHLLFGQDFGYTNDPATLIDIYLLDNALYLDEVFYRTGMLNTDIVRAYESNLIPKNATIIADSSEPKSIDEIYNLGYRGIKGAEKGADSIKFGINLMKQYKIYITKRSINLEKEFRKYKWAQDKNGKSLNVPIDEFNHGIDAVRYGVSTALKKKAPVRTYHASILR